MKQAFLAAGVAIALVFLVAACGSGNRRVGSPAPSASTTVVAPSTASSSTSAPSAITSVPSSTSTTAGPSCDEAAIAASVGHYTRYTAVTGYGCAGDFAYAFVDVPAPMPQGGVTETLQLKATVDSWQVVSRSTYCNDGLVPTAIHHDACETN